MMDISKTKAYQTIEHYYHYILVIGFLVLVLGGGYWFIWPQYTSAKHTSAASYEQAVATLNQHEQYLADLNTMAEHYDTVDKNLLVYVHKILPQLAPEMTFAELEAILRKSKFSISSINISPLDPSTVENASADTMYSVTQVSVNLNGPGTTYADFKELLQLLENTAHLIELSSVNYATDGESYTLAFKVYSL